MFFFWVVEGLKKLMLYLKRQGNKRLKQFQEYNPNNTLSSPSCLPSLLLQLLTKGCMYDKSEIEQNLFQQMEKADISNSGKCMLLSQKVSLERFLVHHINTDTFYNTRLAKQGALAHCVLRRGHFTTMPREVNIQEGCHGL